MCCISWIFVCCIILHCVLDIMKIMLTFNSVILASGFCSLSQTVMFIGFELQTFFKWQLKYQFRWLFFNLAVLSITHADRVCQTCRLTEFSVPLWLFSFWDFPWFSGIWFLLVSAFWFSVSETFFFYQWPIIMCAMAGTKLIAVKIGTNSIQLSSSERGLLYKFPIAALTNYHWY